MPPATDPVFNLQWGLSNTGQAVNHVAGTAGDDISALAAWGMSRGAGITVGVVDSGAQLDHPDLQAQLVPGHDYIDRDEVPTDGSGHGTQVSGIVAAANNTIGVTGAAPDAKVMPLRILNDTGSGSSSNSAAALARAGDLGLRVVNASYGSTGYSNAEETAITDAPRHAVRGRRRQHQQERRHRAAVSVRVYRCQHRLRRGLRSKR